MDMNFGIFREDEVDLKAYKGTREVVKETPECKALEEAEKAKNEAWWNVEGTDKAYEKAWEDLKEADTAVRATREGKALKVLQEAFKVYDEAEKAKDEARDALMKAKDAVRETSEYEDYLKADKAWGEKWEALKATPEYKDYLKAKKAFRKAYKEYEETTSKYLV